MPYIYKITNLINGKMYIGKTSSTIEERWKEHLNDYTKREEEKRPLYDAMNKYKLENFQIEMIEEVIDDIQACEREIYWINKLRTYIGFEDCNGYNATLGGDGKRYYDYKELANAYLKLGTIKAVAEKYNCDIYTVRIACKENKIEINQHPKQKPIKRISKNEEEKEYNSINEAATELYNENKTSSIRSATSTICKALHHPERSKTAYGYKWIFI